MTFRQDGTFDFSIEQRHHIPIQLKNPQNSQLVQGSLSIRYDRRLEPTNKYSFNVKEGYSAYCQYACEYRYFEGAMMFCECDSAVDVNSVDAVFEWNRELGFSRVFDVGMQGEVRDACILLLSL